MSNQHLRARLLALLTLAVLWVSPAADATAGQRIVAIGDIHGAYDELVEILQAAKLVDDKLDWIGVSSRLVQTGDFTDRGSKVRESMDLLMRIERQAAERGGEVHLLLGNHEAMNLIGEDRDALVNPEIFDRFVDAKSEKRRESAFKQWEKWRRKRERVQERLLEEYEIEAPPGLLAFIGQSRDEWMAAHPPGLIEYREALSVGGSYGRWLSDLPVAIKLDDTLFLHGGIAATLAERSLEEINQLHWRRFQELAAERKQLERQGILLAHFSWSQARLALEHHLRFPESVESRDAAIRGWDLTNAVVGDLFAEESPLWFRGYARAPLGLDDEPLAALLDQTDSAYGVRRTVAAHSPVDDHTILSRLDGRVFLIDTGMLASYYGGRPSALEISAAGVAQIYVDAAGEETSLGTNGDSVGVEESLGTNGHGEQEEASAAGAGEETGAEAAAPDPRLFHGADGEPLPFQEREQIERFLRTAVPLSMKPVGQGKTGAQKVVLELDGVRAHGIFHTIDDQRGSPTRPVVLNDGTKVMYFRDSYKGQVAAYELSKLMGMDNVPPAVVREIDGDLGSVALWIENGINLFGWRERGEGDPKDPRLYLQMHDMRVFDALVHNTDRNSQNIFWTGDFVLWLIDHTRTMSQDKSLSRPDRVKRCSRSLFESVKSLDEAGVRERLGPYLSLFEIKALLKRRDRLLDLLDERIRKLGERKVLFDYDSAPGVSYSDEDGPDSGR